MNTDILTLYEIYKSNPVVYIDNRKVTGPGIFFSIKGDKHDGNKYAEDAIEKGAVLAIVDNEEFCKGENYILVEDGLKTLQELAKYHRAQLNIPTIAITGTNGKTTTKELLSSVLSMNYKVHVTDGNFNNHIGLPLTILLCTAEAEIMVLEMGASKLGDIAELCEIAMPTHGIITNIGKAHLEGFNRVENIVKTKKELYDYVLKNNGVFFVGVDVESLKSLAIENTSIKKYGHSVEADYNIQMIFNSTFATLSFIWESESYICDSNLFGGYNAYNMAAAVSIGLYFGIASQDVVTSIQSYLPSNNRSEIVRQGGSTFILDAYNANPSSMAEAIQSFAKMKEPIKSLLIGDMLELGESSIQEHQKIIDLILLHEWEHVVLVGSQFMQTTGHSFNCHQVLESVDFFPKNGSWILIKGSRGIGLEKFLLQ